MSRTISVKGHYRTYNGKKKWIQRHSRTIQSKNPKGKTMFFEPQHKKYSEMIEMDDPESARASVRKLKEEFNKAKTYDKKLRIAKDTQLAENRAGAMLKRENLSSKERAEFREIKQIYGKTSDIFWNKL